MSSTLEVPCRVDYRPAGAQEFCEWTGRVDCLSATGCSIQSAHRPEPGAKLELRIYLPGSAWPIRVLGAEVIWSHWDEFTVVFRNLPICDPGPITALSGGGVGTRRRVGPDVSHA